MAISMSYFLYAKVRSPFFSELYETILSFYTLPAIISTLRNPHDPTFNVTPKGEHVSKDYVSHLGIVFVLVFIFIILGFAAAIYRLIYYPADYEVILATTLWNLLNLVLIVAAIGVSSEKKDTRKNIRIPLDTETIIHTEEHTIVGKITDISEDGIRMLPAEKKLLDIDMHNDIKVSIEIHDINGELFQVPAKFLRSFGGGGHYIFIFEKEKLDIKLRQKLIHLVYGNTTNWKAYDQNKPLMNPHESFIFIIKQSVENVMFKEALVLTFTSLRKKIISKGHQ
jgi:cellulose synthase (UDP-forming)